MEKAFWGILSVFVPKTATGDTAGLVLANFLAFYR